MFTIFGVSIVLCFIQYPSVSRKLLNPNRAAENNFAPAAEHKTNILCEICASTNVL